MRGPVSIGAAMILEALGSIISVIRASPEAVESWLRRSQETEDDELIEETIFESPVYTGKQEPSKETEECPEFQEIFEAGNDLVIGVEYLELSPDERAVIRIVGSATFSKQYRRRVYTLDDGRKYINIDNKRFYIRKARVQS